MTFGFPSSTPATSAAPTACPAEVYGEAYTFLKPEELLSFEEIARIAGLFARLGVVRLRELTGGEPLLRPWLPELVEKLTAIEGIRDLALITNGSHLARVARPLRAAGLRRITVSLDSLDEETFARMNGRAHRLPACPQREFPPPRRPASAASSSTPL